MLLNLLLLFLIHTGATKEVVSVTMVSRHNIRSPYGPTVGNTTDFGAYSPLQFPNRADWNMSAQQFAGQYLTPTGKRNSELIGAYYRERFADLGLGDDVCEKTVCFADFAGDSPRDKTTAEHWLQGFNCSVHIGLVSATNFPSLLPVLSDHADMGCPLATEEQVAGMIGGNFDALNQLYVQEIQLVNAILQVPRDAEVCHRLSQSFDPDTQNCTLAELDTTWIGQYFEIIRSPFTQAAYFADYWMFQYLTGLSEWGFGQLTIDELRPLYSMHVETLWLGCNMWTSRAYGSQQMSYILVSLAQSKEGQALEGMEQASDTKLLLLVSHDTNILYLRRLLGLNWVTPGFSQNMATPGGALNFELWREANTVTGAMEYFVRVVYICATPLQQRQSSPLSMNTPPDVATLVMTNCATEFCPWEDFIQVATSEIDLECMSGPVKDKVVSLMEATNPSNHSDHVLSWHQVFSFMAATFVVGLILGCALSRCFKSKSMTGGDQDVAKLLNAELDNSDHGDALLTSTP